MNKTQLTKLIDEHLVKAVIESAKGAQVSQVAVELHDKILNREKLGGASEAVKTLIYEGIIRVIDGWVNSTEGVYYGIQKANENDQIAELREELEHGGKIDRDNILSLLEAVASVPSTDTSENTIDFDPSVIGSFPETVQAERTKQIAKMKNQLAEKVVKRKAAIATGETEVILQDIIDLQALLAYEHKISLEQVCRIHEKYRPLTPQNAPEPGVLGDIYHELLAFLYQS